MCIRDNASNDTAQISIDGGVTWTTLTVTGTTWRYNDSRTLTDGNYLYQAVSYTHLDVYKRQRLQRRCHGPDAYH